VCCKANWIGVAHVLVATDKTPGAVTAPVQAMGATEDRRESYTSKPIT